MSQGCALWMSESKCQRLRSQCSDYWKWFFAYNCFPFTSAIIKLHAQIPCESRICLTDIGVKNLRSLNWLPRGVFVPLGQPHSSCLRHLVIVSIWWQACIDVHLWFWWGSYFQGPNKGGGQFSLYNLCKSCYFISSVAKYHRDPIMVLYWRPHSQVVHVPVWSSQNARGPQKGE